MDPAAELERLCYAGEELLATEPIGSGVVGVTTHRLLVLTPDGPGARFRAVDRPNVTGVAVKTDGPTSHRDRGAQAGVVGIGLLLAGAFIDLGGLINPVESPSGVGIGGILSLIDVLIAALDLVDEALTIMGLLAVVVALGSLAWYLRGRERVLEIAVAGRDPYRVPIARTDSPAAERLEAALEEAATPG